MEPVKKGQQLISRRNVADLLTEDHTYTAQADQRYTAFGAAVVAVITDEGQLADVFADCFRLAEDPAKEAAPETIDILPLGRILKRISTHVAVLNAGKIGVWTVGFRDLTDGFELPARFLYFLPVNQSDDLFAIFERYEEDNRINLAEAGAEFNY